MIDSDQSKDDPGESADPASSRGVESAASEVQDAVGLNLFVTRLDAQMPDAEAVCIESVVREKHIPPKRDILEEIVKYTLREKFNLESAKVHRIIYDVNRNVVLLEVRVANTDGGNTEIQYIVEGRHGANQASKTSIEWIWTSGEDFTSAESGGTVADYRDGQWSGKIL